MKRILWLLLLILSAGIGFAEISVSSSVTKGEYILITGHNLTANASSTVVISSGDYIINTYGVSNNENGSFSYHYKPSGLDPSGLWNVTVFGESYNVTVSQSINSSTLLISFVSPVSGNIYPRASIIEFKVNITTNLVPVENAAAKAYFNGEVFNLSYDEGLYVYSYNLPYDAEIKPSTLVVTCLKEGLGGEKSISFDVRSALLNLQVSNPSFSSINMGDALPVNFRASYSTGQALINPVISVTANNNPVSFTTENGLDYYGEYKTSDADKDHIQFYIIVTDSAGNTASYSSVINTSGEFLYFVKKNIIILSISAVVIIGILYFSYSKTSSKLSSNRLNSRKNELLELQKKAQEDYFNKGSIAKEAYEKLMNDYDEELVNIKEKLKKG